MLNNKKKLHVSADQLELIEAALHTQSKILNVQASAGEGAALERLNAVKRTLADIARQKPSPVTPAPYTRPWRFSFSRMAE